MSRSNLPPNSLLTSEEIFISSKRNVEGFAVLANYFLPTMISSSLNSALINVNDGEEERQNQKDHKLLSQASANDLFYRSTV